MRPPGWTTWTRCYAGASRWSMRSSPGQSDIDFTRFPKSGFIKGRIKDLAAFLAYAATPEDAVQRAVTILEEGVQDAATILRQAAELSGDTQTEIIEHLKQPYSEQTLRMAATILVNALVFHQNLAGQHGVKNLDQIATAGVLTQASVLEEWRKILGVNYWSIFNIASDLLRSINPPGMAVEALRVMRRTADRLVALGVSQSHDLSGTVFQRLIADRKFLATFYTRPESAALLAHLAIPDDGGWSDAERVKDFRIADYACGTGTLIHAAYRRLNSFTGSQRRPGASSRTHDGERADSVRRSAIIGPFDRVDAVVVVSQAAI